MAQGELNLSDVPGRTPSLCYEGLPPVVVIEQVQRLIDELLFRHDVLPAREILADADKGGPAVRARVVEDHLEILKATGDFAHSVRTLVSVDVDGVYGRAHRLGDLADLCQKKITVCEDDEYILAGLNSGSGVDKRLLDVDVVHVEVATEHAPKDTLKRRQTSPVDRTGDEPKYRVS